MSLAEEMLAILESRLGRELEEYLFPPPVFTAMEGRFLDLDLENGVLRASFPVLERYLNPYRALQGGMIGAAVDNTIGPLSVLVAPPNLTRKLEITFSSPITLETERMIVSAAFEGQEGQRLYFTANVRSPAGLRLARAKAVHYLID